VSVDKVGQPALIEWNSAAELSQVASESAFGDLTEEILTDAMHKNNSRFNNGSLLSYHVCY